MDARTHGKKELGNEKLVMAKGVLDLDQRQEVAKKWVTLLQKTIL